MPHPALGIAFVLLALGGLLGGLGWLQRRCPQHPELIRKFLHIGMGTVTLTLPLLFDKNWPVLFLAIVAVAILLIVKWQGVDRAGVHNVVHGVARNSLGEIYFPVAVAVVFVLSAGDRMLFVVPILVLTLADAVAALIGLRYGQTHYRTDEGVKSVEGSLAFFAVTFLSVHLSLLLFSDIGRLETVLIALLIGVLVMLLEAFAWRGLDNLFIPLGSFLLLTVYRDMDAIDLLRRLAVSVGLIVFVIVWRKKTKLLDSAALAGALIGYVIWAAGDWRWLLPVLSMFLTYALLSPKDGGAATHDTRAVFAITAPGLLWLFVARTAGAESLYFPFTVSFAIGLGLITLVRLCERYPQASKLSLVARSMALAGVIVLIPWMLIMGVNVQTSIYALAGAALVALAAISFHVWQPRIADCPNDLARWARQGGVGMIYSTAALALVIGFPLH